ETAFEAIEPLAGPSPTEARLNGRPLISAESFHWEALFPAEVARARIRERLAGPFRALEAGLEQDPADLSPNQAAVLRRLMRSLLDANADAHAILVEHLTTDFQLAMGASIPDRFREIEARLQSLREGESDTAGLKRAVGWGADLETVLGKIERFNRFLAERRKQVAESAATLSQLEVWARDLRMAEGLQEIVTTIEDSVEALVRWQPKRIVVLDYTEHFTAYLRVALIFGLFLSVPFILYEMWKFVGAGLHLHEQR